MRCKHNRLFHENGKFFCFHCGIYIRDDTICEKKYILKECVNTITGVDARQENQTEENIAHVCPKHVLSIDQGDNYMYICKSKKTVVFNSISPYFEKERDGYKCNTERIFLTQDEETDFINHMNLLRAIIIHKKDTKESFIRKITDISFAELEGLRLYIISWDKDYRYVKERIERDNNLQINGTGEP